MSHKAIHYNRFVTYGSVAIYRISQQNCDKIEVHNKRWKNVLKKNQKIFTFTIDYVDNYDAEFKSIVKSLMILWKYKIFYL